VGRTLGANRLLAGSACGKRQRGRPLNSVVRHHMGQLRPAIIITIIVSACASQPHVAKRPVIPESEQACLAAGGNWANIGLPGMPKRCDLKAGDANRSCTDSSQCEGMCLAPESVPPGASATGHCSPYVRNFGNLREVVNGKVETLNVE
jgi:hypothetical protein